MRGELPDAAAGPGSSSAATRTASGDRRSCSCDAAERTGARCCAAPRIPRRYDHCTFENFEVHNPSHEIALPRGAAVGPRHGRRSSTAAVCCSSAHRARGRRTWPSRWRERWSRSKNARVLFCEQRELLKALQSTFDDAAGRSESDVLAPVLDVEVLVLDDLGAGRTTPWGRDVLHDLITARYNQELPLILTTNLAPGDEPPARASGRTADAALTLRERLGDALMSRLYEMCQIVRVAGNDYRSWVMRANLRSVAPESGAP